MSRKEKEKSNILGSANSVNVIAVMVITVFCIGAILLLAKTIFASNEKDVPAGLYTGTIPNTAMTTTTTTVSSAAPAQSAAITAAPETAAPDPNAPETAYIVRYVQLLEEPQAESKKLICMSPNIKVQVLERRPDGFCKVTFLNGDGTTYVGYALAEDLSAAPVDRNTTTTTTTTKAEEEFRAGPLIEQDAAQNGQQ